MMILMKATNWKHANEGCKSKHVSQKSQVVHKCCWNFNLCRVLTDHSPANSKESKGILAGIASTHRTTICSAWRSFYSQRDFLACPWAVFSFIFESFFLWFWEMFQKFNMTNATAPPQNQTAASTEGELLFAFSQNPIFYFLTDSRVFLRWQSARKLSH